jgi:hypothetical protein
LVFFENEASVVNFWPWLTVMNAQLFDEKSQVYLNMLAGDDHRM